MNQSSAPSKSSAKQPLLRNRKQGVQDQAMSCFSEEMDQSAQKDLWGFTKNSIKYTASIFLSDS